MLRIILQTEFPLLTNLALPPAQQIKNYKRKQIENTGPLLLKIIKSESQN